MLFSTELKQISTQLKPHTHILPEGIFLIPYTLQTGYKGPRGVLCDMANNRLDRLFKMALAEKVEQSVNGSRLQEGFYLSKLYQT